MHIMEIKNNVKDERVKILEDLYRNTGNNCMNGYIENGINNISRDEFNHLYYDSYNISGNLETYSRGTILDDNSIVIKQIQTNNKDKNYYQIFGIDSEGKKYTYLDFESEKAMNEADFRVRRNNTNLCSGDLTESLRNIGVDFDSIGQVRINVEFPSIALNEMVNEETKKEEETSFVMY